MSTQFGSFDGTVQTEWLPDGRNMLLLADFAFLDQDGVRWEAPRGATINGASIARFFWRVIGGPYEGKYRLASVVHDWFCTSQTRPARAVHQMFYQACRAGGIGPIKAWLMWAAVRFFGPKWE
jgi:hypothetical protein